MELILYCWFSFLCSFEILFYLFLFVKPCNFLRGVELCLLRVIGLKDFAFDIFFVLNPPKMGSTGVSIFFVEVSQRPEKRFNIFLLKVSFLKVDKNDFVLSVLGVLKALLLDLKSSLALAGVYPSNFFSSAA